MQPLEIKPAETSSELKPTASDRRRRVRHKVHSPAYISFTENSGNLALDLNEVLDISEQGLSVQTSEPLQVNRSLNLRIDLSETQGYIPATGEVVWSGAGRAGLHFPQLSDASVARLKEWLFLNAIAACDNRAEPELTPELTVQPTDQPITNAPVPDDVSREEESDESIAPDYTSMLTALAAVSREVEGVGPNLDMALQLVAQRARTFTRSTGAAIALFQASDMICVATSGPDAPGLGVRLQAGSGFSGECIRSGRLLRCDDSETDPRVDRESCRQLGIRSMVAVPVRLGERVIGLLEVFSPQPEAFAANDNLILQHLAETILAAINREARATARPTTPLESGSSSRDEFSEEAQNIVSLEQPSSVVRRILLIAAAATLLVVLLWLSMPAIRDFSRAGKVTAKPPVATKPALTVADTASLESLRALAEQGDPAAQFAVGAHYATGDEVKQDYTEAVRWFSMAADHGHVVAQATLGAYYWAGRGVPLDLDKAYFWSILAQTGGDEASKYRVAVLASRMTRAQVIADQQAANDWIKQHQLVSKAQ